MSRRPLVLVMPMLFLAPLANCACEDPALEKVAPKIAILPPDDGDPVICETDDIYDCSHDFGGVEIGQGRFFKFVIANPSPVPLVIKEIKFSEDTNADVFSLNGEPPTEVLAEAKQEGPVEVVVQFAPLVENNPDEPVLGKLIIVSDAANLAPDDKEQVVIELRGYGIDGGQPDIVVTPEECNFGEVGSGVKTFCDVNVQNIGQKDLILHSIGFSEATPFPEVFNSETIVAPETYIGPGTAKTIRLSATPIGADAFEGALELTTNDPDTPDVAVPLFVQGADAPTAIAEVESINGVENNDPTPQVKPLDDVVFTGVNSVSPNVDGQIVEWHWSIVDKPVESSVELTDPDSETTGFVFSSSGVPYQGVDVAGPYTVGLTVVDSDGSTSTNTAQVTINAIPSDSLHLQLTWASPSYDLDLHLVKDGGAWCSANSCYYGNCSADQGQRPEWDGIQGATDGDPSLDIDDLSGYGPENINIDIPVTASYTIGVHVYEFVLNDPVFATVKVFVNGALNQEWSREMQSGRDFWEVADVQWNGSTAIVFPIDDYESGWTCGPGF